MPTYLCHGFRWHRREIRIFVILNDIDDAAPDWIVGRTSSASLLSQFAQNFDFLPKEPIAIPEAVLEHADAAQDQPRPHRDDDLSVPPSRVPPSEDDVLANDWSPVKLLEEYDVEETQSASRPYAFVADYVVRVDLSVNVGDEMARYEAASAAATKDDADGWFEKLRDKLQVGERIGWHIVVCADEERVAPDEGSSDEYDFSDEGAVTPTRNLNLPMRPAAEAPPGREQRPPTASAKAEAAKGKEKQEASQQPDFLRNDPIKTSPQPGLRHKLSTKGLRRLFSKKDGS